MLCVFSWAKISTQISGSIGLFFTQVYPGGTYSLRESLQTFANQALID